MAKRSFYISQELDNRLSTISKKLHRSKSFIICQALENHLADLLEDLEDYNDAIAALNKIEEGEKTISWEVVQIKNDLLN